MRKFLLPIIVVIAAVLYSSVVVVTEGTRGIMLRFNKVQRDAENKVVVYEPGLHFKLPLIDSIKVLDARIRTLDGSATRFVTVEKKRLIGRFLCEMENQRFRSFLYCNRWWRL